MRTNHVPLRVFLIANYRLDGQQSMQRFAEMMAVGLSQSGLSVETLTPQAYLGRGSRNHGLGKWLRYLDKYVIFPHQLRRRLRTGRETGPPSRDLVHICDHSNSVYAQTVRRLQLPLVITCHDLGAVRGALGEETDCRASRSGKVLQAWIARGLGMADVIACDSSATRHDVERLIRSPNGLMPKTQTVLLGQNTDYQRLDEATAGQRLAGLSWYQQSVPFVLNVGSSLSRKNREGVIRIFAQTKNQWNALLIFAGQALTAAHRRLVEELGLQGRVFEALSPSNEVLEALYNRAEALLFPSKFEGFGWPVIEAQACGCPVLCSDAGSLAEVAGESAFVQPWTSEDQFAAELLLLAIDKSRRNSWAEKGFANLGRFETQRMVDDYVRIYEEVVAFGDRDIATKGATRNASASS